MKTILIATAAVALLSIRAEAQSRTINTQTIVWVDDESMKKGFRLLDAKADFEMVAEYIACMPSPGDKVVITDAGWTVHEIKVISGDSRGCSGLVAMEHVD